MASSSLSASPASDIVSAADRFVKLWRIYSAWKAIEPEFEQLKKLFREVAGNRTMEFPASDNSAAIMVEQKPDSTCRKVSDAILPEAMKLCGEGIFDLHTLHPSRQREANFQLNALKILPKPRAQKLIALYTEPSTPIVRLLPR